MPSEARAQAALGHILDNIRLASELTAGTDAKSFVKDWRSFYAGTRCLEIISEASRRLDSQLKARHSSVNWRDIAASGNVYRHGYEVVEPEQVWRTIVMSLPGLQAAIMAELGNGSERQPP